MTEAIVRSPLPVLTMPPLPLIVAVTLAGLPALMVKVVLPKVTAPLPPMPEIVQAKPLRLKVAPAATVSGVAVG